jgi:hypothetical protein
MLPYCRATARDKGMLAGCLGGRAAEVGGFYSASALLLKANESDERLDSSLNSRDQRPRYGEGVIAMARRLSAIAAFLAAALVLGAISSPAHAQPAPWQADKGYENGIPIGTKITQANWQQYQQFMPESMIHLFKGDLFWHMPQGIEIDVGPTRHILPPKPFAEDTEKYGSQTSLVKTSDGGYVPKGYVGGFPFANPMAGDKGQLLLYPGPVRELHPHRRLEHRLFAAHASERTGVSAGIARQQRLLLRRVFRANGS